MIFKRFFKSASEVPHWNKSYFTYGTVVSSGTSRTKKSWLVMWFISDLSVMALICFWFPCDNHMMSHRQKLSAPTYDSLKKHFEIIAIVLTTLSGLKENDV